jgi:hypothetical protein
MKIYIYIYKRYIKISITTQQILFNKSQQEKYHDTKNFTYKISTTHVAIIFRQLIWPIWPTSKIIRANIIIISIKKIILKIMICGTNKK